MTTVLDTNVHCISLEGTFDDCQDVLKSLFADKDFNRKYRLGTVNSINWARILVQIVYYFKTFLELKREGNLEGKELQFIVPTGNFGDILAGYYAKRMGVPMGKLVVATNANDILTRFWEGGVYEKVPSNSSPLGTASDANGTTLSPSGTSTPRPDTPRATLQPAAGASDGRQSASHVHETLSPAMDIMVSSNFERLLWYLAFEANGNDSAKAGETVLGWMDNVKRFGRCAVGDDVLELAKIDFSAQRASDEQVRSTMRLVDY